MPVTAALLKKLKETLGEEATSDLVTWVDQAAAHEIAQLRELADLHYRQLRELGELHYSRFEARLEQRLAEVRSDVIKWMFIFWGGTIVPLAGLMVALVRL